ncbi:MAG: hypothetical protein Q8M16_11135, partial [Pirellulaceae bacterium]|nr:hypothetical protein [Pirellulaceae bacterium]
MTMVMSRWCLIRACVAFVLVIGLSGLPQPTKAQDADEFKSIFDGKTLKGWAGAEGYWSVEDEAITGQFTAENN